MTFEENVLLHIKRNFSKEESIAFLQSELSKASFKNGEILSENAELKYENHLLRTEIQQMKKQPIADDYLKEERFKKLQKKLTEQGSLIEKLRSDVDYWRTKCFHSNADSNAV